MTSRLVRSVLGYWIRFGLHDSEGMPEVSSPGHNAPAERVPLFLLAPGSKKALIVRALFHTISFALLSTFVASIFFGEAVFTLPLAVLMLAWMCLLALNFAIGPDYHPFSDELERW